MIPQPYPPINGDAGEASEIELEWAMTGPPTKSITGHVHGEGGGGGSRGGRLMAEKTRVEIVGWDELAAGTRQLVKNLEQRVPGEFGRVANQVASTVKGRVPKRTGALAASVTGSAYGETAFVEMGTEYARYVEYGGRGHPRSSQGNYLYPAAQEAEPALIAAGERAAEQAIGATSWPNPS